MIAAHSTVPRWPAEAPALDLSGRSYGVVAMGAAAGPTAAAWVERILAGGQPCWVLDDDSAGAEVLADLDRRLAAERTGFRLLLAGPERDVLVTQAAARAAGLLDAEITIHVTGAPLRRVYCVHCKHTSEVIAEVEQCAPCAGCGRELLVFAHLSRRSGSYLGFLAAAEELP